MSYATIRAAIKTALEAVVGITGGAGIVTDYHPHVTRAEDYDAFFKSTDGSNRINGWTISREAKREEQRDSGYLFRIVHEIIVRGYFSLRTGATNENETTFQDLIDTITTTLRGSIAIWVE